MLCFLGGAMGYATALFAKLEQLMCSKGYSTEIAGLSGSLMVIIGKIARCVIWRWNSNFVRIQNLSNF